MGISQSRNPKLASVFYRMRLVESYGTGIDKIRRFYEGYENQLIFWTAEGAFGVKIYNENEMTESVLSESKSEYGRKRQQSSLRADFSRKKDMIYATLKSQGRITRKEVEALLDIKTTKAFRILKEMCEEGMLVQENSGRITCYYLKD